MKSLVVLGIEGMSQTDALTFIHASHMYSTCMRGWSVCWCLWQIVGYIYIYSNVHVEHIQDTLKGMSANIHKPTGCERLYSPWFVENILLCLTDDLLQVLLIKPRIPSP